MSRSNTCSMWKVRYRRLLRADLFARLMRGEGASLPRLPRPPCRWPAASTRADLVLRSWRSAARRRARAAPRLWYHDLHNGGTELRARPVVIIPLTVARIPGGVGFDGRQLPMQLPWPRVKRKSRTDYPDERARPMRCMSRCFFGGEAILREGDRTAGPS